MTMDQDTSREFSLRQVGAFYCFAFLKSALIYYFVGRGFTRLLAFKKTWAQRLVFSIYLLLYCFTFYFSAGKAIYFPAKGAF